MSRLIAEVGQLKPSIRLGQAISEFSAILDSEAKAQFSQLRLSNTPPKEIDIIKFCEEINFKIRRTHKVWKGHGTRIQSTLGSVQALAAAGDVMLGCSQNLIACGVWATIRTALIGSISYFSLFEKITGVLDHVSRTASVHRHLVDLFRRDRTLCDMVCEYLTTVVELCQYWAQFENKAAVTRFVAGFDMDKQIQSFEDRLMVWATIINEQVQLLQSQLAVEMSEKMTLTQKRQVLFDTSSNQQRDKWCCLELMKKLCPNQDEFDRAWRRQFRKGSIKWLFATPEFLKFTSSPAAELRSFLRSEKSDLSPSYKSTLLITGGLGMGKTVTMANVVSHLVQDEEAGVIHLFIERSSPKTWDADVLLGSVAHQFVRLAVEAGSRASGNLPKLARELMNVRPVICDSTIGDIIQASMSLGHEAGIRSYYLVVDGLDYLDPDIACAIIRFLAQQAQKHPRFVSVSCCFSLRTGSVLEEILALYLISHSRCVSVDVSSKDHLPELQSYIHNELEWRPGFKELSKATQAQIEQVIWSLADGMYLWASLQIDHLFPKYGKRALSERDIVGLLEYLPGPLASLFDSALKSIGSKDQPMIFQLVIAAKRPLNVFEILVALYTGFSADLSCMAPCEDAVATIYKYGGGLLELDLEDESVYFVHSSVYYYLTDPNKNWGEVFDSATAAKWEVTPEKCDQYLAKVCLRYLDLPIHEQSVTTHVKPDKKDYTRAVSTIQTSLEAQSPIIKLAVRLRGHSPTEKATTLIDLQQVAKGYLEDQTRLRRKSRQGQSKIDPTAFLDYASVYWLEHSDHFLFDVQNEFMDDSLHAPFMKVLHGTSTAHGQLPFRTEMIRDKPGLPLSNNGGKLTPEMEWAHSHGHLRLLWGLLETLDSLPHDEKVAYTSLLRNHDASIMKGPDDASALLQSVAGGFRVCWEWDNSLLSDLHTPFLHKRQQDDLPEEQQQLVFDAWAVVRLYILGQHSLQIRSLVESYMWDVFRNPQLQRMYEYRNVAVRIGSFYTDPQDSQPERWQSKVSRWVSERSG